MAAFISDRPKILFVSYSIMLLVNILVFGFIGGIILNFYFKHFLILNTTNENAGKIKEGLDKAFIQYDEKIPIKDSLPNTYRIVKILGKFDENSASSLSQNKFHRREYKNNYKTIENEAFTPFKCKFKI